VTLRSCEMEFH